MKPILLSFIVCAVLLCGCQKKALTSEVVYYITETSAATPAYEIMYTNDIAGGQIVTSYNTNTYSSGKITLEQGQFITMKVSCTEPVYTLNCSIFINGNLWKTGSLNSGGSLTLSGEIPAE
jgi:hypothetical protein